MSSDRKKGFRFELCPKSSKSYATERGYKKHLAIHSDTKPDSETRTPKDVDSFSDPNLYICNVCDKTYKTKGGLRQHTLLHTRTTTSAEQSSSVQDVDFTVDLQDLAHHFAEPFLLAEDGIGEESYFELIDEEEERAREQAIAGESAQEPPKKKRMGQKPKRPAVMKCIECKTSYQSLETYLKHVRCTHAIKDFYAIAPAIDTLKEECSRLAKVVLEEIKSCNFSVGPAAQVALDVQVLLDKSSTEKWILLTQSVCEGVFNDILSKQQFLTPSQLRETFTRRCNLFMASENERCKLLNMLSDLLTSPKSIQIMTLNTFMRRFAKKLLAFFMHLMVHKGNNLPVSLSTTYRATDQSVTSLDYKRNMHYIGGSNVHSVLRTGLLKKNPSDEWKRIIMTLKTFFLAGEVAAAPDNEIIAWTVAQDRGKLIKISEDAHNFFVKLGELVKPLEQLDGSLYIDEVMQSISSCPDLLYLWDTIFKGCLNSTESFKLLHSICSHFCNTWRSGIVGRRSDELSRKSSQRPGQGGVAFRSNLSR